MAEPKKVLAKKEPPRKVKVEEEIEEEPVEKEKPKKEKKERQYPEIFKRIKGDLKRLGLEKVYAETLGTFVFVFFGAGSVLATSISGGVNYLTIGLASGLALSVVIYSFSRISGALINPAVTIALFLTGKMKIERAVYYVIF